MAKDLKIKRTAETYKATTDLLTSLNGADSEEEAEEVFEPKTARLFLYIKPSTAKLLERQAKKLRTSKNQIVNDLLEAYLKG